MNYELYKKLKDVGFPQTTEKWLRKLDDSEPMLLGCADCSTREIADVSAPTLEELIEACGDNLSQLDNTGDGWRAFPQNVLLEEVDTHWAKTPAEAVARLWLALNRS